MPWKEATGIRTRERRRVAAPGESVSVENQVDMDLVETVPVRAENELWWELLQRDSEQWKRSVRTDGLVVGKVLGAHLGRRGLGIATVTVKAKRLGIAGDRVIRGLLTLETGGWIQWDFRVGWITKRNTRQI